MDMETFMMDVVAPKAIERVLENQTGDEVSFGTGNPYFHRENVREIKKKMKECYMEVIEELITSCEKEAKDAFFEYRIINSLLEPISGSNDNAEVSENIKFRIKEAKENSDNAYQKWVAAFNARSYIESHVR